jgi:hypothetical protein
MNKTIKTVNMTTENFNRFLRMKIMGAGERASIAFSNIYIHPFSSIVDIVNVASTTLSLTGGVTILGGAGAIIVGDFEPGLFGIAVGTAIIGVGISSEHASDVFAKMLRRKGF